MWVLIRDISIYMYIYIYIYIGIIWGRSHVNVISALPTGPTLGFEKSGPLDLDMGST